MASHEHLLLRYILVDVPVTKGRVQLHIIPRGHHLQGVREEYELVLNKQIDRSGVYVKNMNLIDKGRKDLNVS